MVVRTLKKLVTPASQQAPSPENRWIGWSTELCDPVFNANGAALRQSLGEIGLSIEFSRFALALRKEFDDVLGGARIPLDAGLPPRVHQKLGKTAAALFSSALLHEYTVWNALNGTDFFESLDGIDIAPEDFSAKRYEFALGGVLPARAARFLLSSIRGEAAMMALACGVHGPGALHEWRAVALGEAALAGSRAKMRMLAPLVPGRLPVPEHAWINLDDAASEQALRNLESEERLLKGAPLDPPDETVDLSADDDA